MKTEPSPHAAIYARHSTDKQQGSTDDQIARCLQHCRERGYTIAGVFRDDGISGAALPTRPGVRRLIAAALRGDFDRIVIEDLSRLSRDQGDIAQLFKRFSFADIVLETVSDGNIGELQIGLKGTMNALYLKDLADKTRRGMIAAVRRGSVPGGKLYGYDIVHRLDDHGEPIRGARAINPEQAEIVRRIFAAYVEGTSLKRICADLNALGVPAPAGGRWGPSTLVGTASRATGLLRQTLYKGVVTFNRMHFRKHPDSGKRLSVPRPAADWVLAPIPELAILDAALFDRVQDLLEERSTARRAAAEQRQAEDAAARAAREAKQQRTRRLQQIRTPQKTFAVFSGRLHCARHDLKMRTQRWRVYACPEAGCASRNLGWAELMPLCADALGRLSAAAITAHFTAPDVVAARDGHAAAAKDLSRQIATRRDAVRHILTTLGPASRTETVRQVLEEQEQEIRRLGVDLARHQRAVERLQPPPAVIEAALARFRALLAQLRTLPEDHRFTIPLRACVQRFDVETLDAPDQPHGRRRAVTAVFDVPKIMELAREAEED